MKIEVGINFSTATLLAIVVLHVITVSEVNGLKCVQCMGTPKFDKPCFYGDFAATECSDVNHTYCISYFGHISGLDSLSVVRNCSATYIRSECQAYPLDSLGRKDHMQVCSYTCNTDGCNNNVNGTSYKICSSLSISSLAAILIIVNHFATINLLDFL